MSYRWPRFGLCIGICATMAACGNGHPPPGTSGSAPAAATNQADCGSAGDIGYVCGPRNAEDILPIGDTDWLLLSGLSAESPRGPTGGHLYLVNRATKTQRVLFPGDDPAFRPDTEVFADCPGPIDVDNFSAHGLALAREAQNRYRLYMTSHGAREAIEAFDIDTNDDEVAIAWVGCVPLPADTYSNSVVILSDGGFLATKMMDPSVPDAFARVRAGEITGVVYEWHPGGAVTAVSGTELSGNNGIALSPDERWLYVTATGTRQIVRFDRRADPITREAVSVDIAPDNIRWSDDGMLYTIGANYVPPAECPAPPCATGWSVVEVDPDSLQAVRIAGVDQNAAVQNASTALAVGDRIWVGTFSGDRVAYLPRP